MVEEKLIQKLTQEQKDRIPEFRDKWTKIALSTEPADRDDAEQGIIECYKIAGLSAPKIVWCGSPLGNYLARDIVKSSVNPLIKSSVNIIARDALDASVLDSARESVKNLGSFSVGKLSFSLIFMKVRFSVRYLVRDAISDSVNDALYAGGLHLHCEHTANPVWDIVVNSIHNTVNKFAYSSAYGQHDDWLGYYEYLKVVCGLVNQTEKLSGLLMDRIRLLLRK